MPKIVAIVPAKDEAKTIVPIITMLGCMPELAEVIAVDSFSHDDTGTRAAAAGARVVRLEYPGKGEAMIAGVAATDADIIIFLDADLLHLTADHVMNLVNPILRGTADMVVGIRERFSMWVHVLVHFDPLFLISGERAMRREVFETLPRQVKKGWWVEIALNAWAKKQGYRMTVTDLHGLGLVIKEQKWGLVYGLWDRAREWAQVFYIRATIWHKLRSVS